MSNFFHVFLSVIFFFCLNLTAASRSTSCKREKPCSFTTSVIVPCHHRHAIHLHDLLKCYSEQTLLPDEIVISVSGIDDIDADVIESVENENWPFNLIIIKHSRSRSAGANRNCACKHSLGDILICQDCDDIPHPQRVEIIKYVFDHYDISHLLHKIQGNSDFKHHDDISHIPFSITSSYSIKPLAQGYGHGVSSILKKVWEQVQWTGGIRVGEDVDFNNRVYEKFSNNMMVGERLYLYRNQLSSFRKTRRKRT